MFFFITCLRALAACLITNSHYAEIYPIPSLATGGLLGDVLFFAVSGFCLYNVRFNFFKWYGKRLYRIYPPVIFISLFYVLLGYYVISDTHNVFYWFIYPTNYQFIASIIILYIPFYFVVRIKWTKNHLALVSLLVFLLYLLFYIFFYDKSTYRIDNVDEPMIRFLFFESMLLGAWFRNNLDRFNNKFHIYSLFLLVLMMFLYFGTKVFFSKTNCFLQFQLINQIILFGLLFILFWIFISLESRLTRLPSILKRLITFVSSITLEIYIVQGVLKWIISPVGYFPLNFILLTGSIILSAYTLHLIYRLFYYVVEKAIHAIKR